MITQELLKKMFEYKDGDLYWKIKPCKNKPVGLKAGYINNIGYVIVNAGGRQHGAHRLIYILLKGDMPYDFIIDHKNRIRHDNRIDNLRLCTHSQNMSNIIAHKDSQSGFKGVSYDKTRGKWVAQICYNGKSKYIGRFSSAILAHEAYKKESILLYKEFSLFKNK